MRKILFSAAIVAFGVLASVSTAHAGGNTLMVTAGAAIDGNFGLEMQMNSDTNNTYVAENMAHNAELSHNVDFKIDVNGLTMGDFTNHTIHMSRRVTPNGNQIKINLARQNGQFKIIAYVKRENGNFKWQGKWTITPATLRNRVQYNWVTASDMGETDGQFRLIKGIGVQFENLTLDNFGTQVDVVRFGSAQGADVTTSGTFDLDTYIATR